MLSSATLWLIAALVLSAVPEGAEAENLGFAHVILQFEEIEGAPGLLYYPRVYTDAQGAVYVTDEGGHRVIRLAGGAPIRADVTFGSEGSGPGELQRPHGVAIDAAGNVFVADSRLGRINKYAHDGRFVTSASLPHVANLAVDSQGRLIAYPGEGRALLQRFSNDLNESEPLLEKAESPLHHHKLGVLIAMDSQDRLFLLDQMGPRLVVFDRDMQVIDGWDLDPPGLRQTIEERRAAMLQRSPEIPGSAIGVAGVQSMALDPFSGRLVFDYLVKPAGEKFTQVATYTLDGQLQGLEIRDTKVYATAFTADGYLLEGDAEQVWVRGPQPARTSSSN